MPEWVKWFFALLYLIFFFWFIKKVFGYIFDILEENNKEDE